jgi:hypothetical protein
MNEVERLPVTFETELAKIYADNKPARREYILGAVARLRSRYNAKLQNLRASAPAHAVDAAERAIMQTENKFAASLAA